MTLDHANVLWLKGRALGGKKRSLSDALDAVITEARRGGHGADAPRSVVGSVDIAEDDPGLERADAALQLLFSESIGRPVLARERSPAAARPRARSIKARRG